MFHSVLLESGEVKMDINNEVTSAIVSLDNS